MPPIRATPRNGSVSYRDAFTGCQSLQRYGPPHPVNPGTSMVARRTSNRSTGIEGFGAFAKPRLYTDGGVVTDHFLMDRTESAVRFNHRSDLLVPLFLYR